MEKYTCPYCLEKFDENEKWYCCKEAADETHLKVADIKSNNRSASFGNVRFAKWISKQSGIPYKGKDKESWEGFWAVASKGIFKVKSSHTEQLAPCPICKNPRVFQRVCSSCFEEIDPNEKVSVISFVGEKQADINHYIAALVYQIKEVLLNIRHTYIISFNKHAMDLCQKFGSSDWDGLGKERAIVTFKNSKGKHSFVFNTYEFDEKPIQEKKEELLHLIESDYIVYLTKAEEFTAVMKNLGTADKSEINSNSENDMDRFISYLREALITLGEKAEVQAMTTKKKLQIPFGLIVTGKEYARLCAIEGENTEAYIPATSIIKDNYDGMWDKLSSNSESTKKELERFDEIMLVKTIEEFFEKNEYFFVTTPESGVADDHDVLNPFMSIASKLARTIIKGEGESDS